MRSFVEKGGHETWRGHLRSSRGSGGRISIGGYPRDSANSHKSCSTQVVPPEGRQSGTTTCAAFADQQIGNAPASQGELTVLVGQFLRGASDETKPESGPLPKDIRILVATVPDPLHTLLNLPFDRTIDAIQQAAQDQGYTYDSSWLPWKAEATEYSGRSDQNADNEVTSQRELCPGLILFRQSMHRSTAQRYDDTYSHGLFVFLVGEKPTTGINRVQWDNALKWIQEHVDKKQADHALRVLGPTFFRIGSLRDPRAHRSWRTGRQLFQCFALYRHDSRLFFLTMAQG